ncbi:expressed protein [Phakopsora pachyrhizi]|uniref:Expressed protein n=1 Tax=Phakopsora pachyrhizi TaxID=170000 RepID=A0AAV0BHI3_PHAPC|nr:expressed protein [Phakopsora pachyrhizi]
MNLMAENLSANSGYFTQDTADVSDDRKELQFETTSKTNQSSSRNHFTWTCPSLYQVNPGISKEGTSFDILREFMSRPDRAPQSPQIDSKAPSRETKSFQKFSSILETDQSSSNLSYLGQEEVQNESNNRDIPVSVGRSSILGSSHKESTSLMSLLIKNTEADSLLDKENYRCPNCNRLCKSLASFEKHQSACTHRNGALSLECRFFNRPYT